MLTAIIPARIGSKGIKKKNIKLVGGRPLISWTLEFAYANNDFDRVLVTIDDFSLVSHDKLMMSSGKKYHELREGQTIRISEKVYLHKRRKQHATDEALTFEFVADALSSISESKTIDNNSIMLLQPTSPFRRLDEVDKILKIAKQFSSVASVKIADSPHPMKTFQLTKGGASANISDVRLLQTPRQSLPTVYSLDGAYYLIKETCFFKHNSMLTPNFGAYIRNKEFAINIDNDQDLKLAKLFAKKYLTQA